MLFRFRVCPDDDGADTAQGWVVASSEWEARELIGEHSYFAHMRCTHDLDIEHGTVLITDGALPRYQLASA